MQETIELLERESETVAGSVKVQEQGHKSIGCDGAPKARYSEQQDRLGQFTRVSKGMFCDFFLWCSPG